jgi:hypothetical protein
VTRILALDLSMSNTGFACWGTGDAKVMSGAWVLGSEYSSYGKVFAKLHEQMSDLAAMGALDAVYYEESLHLKIKVKESHKRAHMLSVGLGAHVESWCYAMGVRPRPVDMAHWRAHFLVGMPRPKNRDGSKVEDALKISAMEKCRLLGFKPRSYDEAEALGVLDFAVDEKQLPAPWHTKLQQAIFAAPARLVHA